MKKIRFKMFILFIFLNQSACANFQIEETSSIVVSIIDTGFDIRHPSLKVPVVDSYDFFSNKPDVTPYIYEVDPSSKVYKRSLALVSLIPELEQWFSPHRNIELEFKNAAFHGTAVASLAVYDLPVSVALYKVYPIPNDVDPDEWMTASVVGAISRSVRNGARVINLSLGFNYELESPDVRKHQELMKTVQDLIRSNPEVLFIAAAGNENLSIDNVSVSGYPCGLAEPNVICVGAITHQYDLWNISSTKGTNLVEVPSAITVFAYGDKVFSAVPQKMCVRKESINTLFSQEPITKDSATALLKLCTDNHGYAFGEATSIATPLVTRKALNILISRPSLTVAELTEEILKSTQTLKSDSDIRYIEPATPSWAKFW